MNNGPLSFLLAAVLLLTLAAQPATAAAKPGKNFILTAADFTDQGPIPVALARPLAGGRHVADRQHACGHFAPLAPVVQNAWTLMPRPCR